jgi:cholesterol oxidase
MHRLSSPLNQMKNHYTVVVIGSGYGGSISASRFARAGKDVCVLERGREYLSGEYPDTQAEAIRETQIDGPDGHLGSRTGLLNFHLHRDINVLVGCGLGGTSLINAGVALAPDPRVFDDPRWPAEFRKDKDTRLSEGFSRAGQMLQPSPYPAHFPAIHKLQALEKSANALQAEFYRPPINVTFEKGPNHAGVEQNACIGCGDCVSGCNYEAKNTTLMNYLPDARSHGAEIFTQVGVRHLERQDGRWLVHYQPVNSGREKFNAPTLFVSADIVVLAAGTLGSTEILLRSQAAGLTASSHLGRHFTGNGDVLGFTYNSRDEINGLGFGPNKPEGREPVGPCITGIIDLRGTANLNDGMVIEEGAVPGAIANLMPLALSAAASVMGKDTTPGIADNVREKGAELESLIRGPYAGATRHTQTYLVMSHDDGEGKMSLDKDRLKIDWPGVGSQPLFERINQKLLDSTKALGGTYVRNPTWSKLTHQNLTSVHPLGGCAMAESAEQGVVNHKGQVFASTAGNAVYDNLVVCDGSIIPRPLGINPLLTISAIAERNCALLAADRGWTINYSPTAPTVTVPVQAAKPGVQFTETMKGFFSTAEKQDFEKGAAAGKQAGSSFQFILTIVSDDVEKMLADADHKAAVAGTVTAPALSAQALTASEGVFQLLTEDPNRVETRNLIYRMKLTSEEGKTYYFHGIKFVHDDPGEDVWKDTTTLFITVYDGDSEAAAVLGKGILEIKPQDFAIQLQTMQVTNVENPQKRMEWTAKFGQYFAGVLFDTYGGVVVKQNRIDPTKPPKRKKRPLRMEAPEVYWIKTDDDVKVRLTRYAGGTKGPVVLSPGFGVSTMSFSTDTIETNLPEYLYANGYDVWLFDYRASPDLSSAATMFSLDDIAQKDYPAAVAKVLEVTKADSVQMLVHCIGSMTFLMAKMAGLQGVRSAICSQLGIFPVTSTVNEVKAGLHVAGFLQALGQTTVDTNLAVNDWRNKLAAAVIQMFPRKELCKSSVCHQVRLIFGESYKHDQLNAATHDALYEMFGVANIRTFKHILLTIEKKHVVDEHGNDIYMPHVDLLNFPICFIQGAENGLFLPEGTRKTFHHLCDTNGPRNYIHIMMPNYAHMDLFVGRNAVEEVYPTLHLELEKYN